MNAKVYKQQMQEFQSYVGDIPSETVNFQGLTPPKVSESEICNMLANAVLETQQNKLTSIGWRITTKWWKETLYKLENLKPIILTEENTKTTLAEWLQCKRE